MAAAGNNTACVKVYQPVLSKLLIQRKPGRKVGGAIAAEFVFVTTG
jgi:hypothetical protein